MPGLLRGPRRLNRSSYLFVLSTFIKVGDVYILYSTFIKVGDVYILRESYLVGVDPNLVSDKLWQLLLTGSKSHKHLRFLVLICLLVYYSNCYAPILPTAGSYPAAQVLSCSTAPQSRLPQTSPARSSRGRSRCWQPPHQNFPSLPPIPRCI